MARTFDTLYHYTDANGLFGIVTSASLRLSDARFLNDRTEFSHGIAVVRDVIDNALAETDEDPLLFETKVFLEPEMVSRRLYVFSLSETAESISQWQRYGADGSGYCIGFEVERLRSMFTRRAKLRHMLYDRDEQFAAIQEALAKGLDESRAKLERYGPDDTGARTFHAAMLAVRLEEVALQFKNPYFHDEYEWRLIAEADDFVDSKFKRGFAPRGNYIKPFIDVAADETDKDALPIVSITCGPRLDSEVAELSVTAFAGEYGYEFVRGNRSTLIGTWR